MIKKKNFQFVLHRENFLTSKQCDELIEKFGQSNSQKSTVAGTYKGDDSDVINEEVLLFSTNPKSTIWADPDIVPAGVESPPPEPNPSWAADSDVKNPDWLICTDEENIPVPVPNH